MNSINVRRPFTVFACQVPGFYSMITTPGQWVDGKYMYTPKEGEAFPVASAENGKFMPIGTVKIEYKEWDSLQQGVKINTLAGLNTSELEGLAGMNGTKENPLSKEEADVRNICATLLSKKENVPLRGLRNYWHSVPEALKVWKQRATLSPNELSSVIEAGSKLKSDLENDGNVRNFANITLEACRTTPLLGLIMEPGIKAYEEGTIYGSQLANLALWSSSEFELKTKDKASEPDPVVEVPAEFSAEAELAVLGGSKKSSKKTKVSVE